MAYDRDSFLSGLAVGRTLWRPHEVAPGVVPLAVQCFAQGEFPPCDWTWDYYGLHRDLVALDIQAGGSGWGWGSPSYWFLMKYSSSHPGEWIVCSPDASYQGGNTSVITMGLDADGNTFGTGQTIRQDQAVDGVGYGRHWIRYGLTEYGDFSDFLVRYPVCYPYGESTLQAFLNSARLTEIDGQKYLIGARS